LGNPASQFTSFTCLNDSCSLARATLTAFATRNLATGPGSYEATLIVDFSPGGSCNIVDESSAWVFDKGTIFTHSYHEDCALYGLRIDTTFEVTGGTGAFLGATGSGREFGAGATSSNAKAPVIYDGTITFQQRKSSTQKGERTDPRKAVNSSGRIAAGSECRQGLTAVARLSRAVWGHP
jgi:hypothetical protein